MWKRKKCSTVKEKRVTNGRALINFSYFMAGFVWSIHSLSLVFLAGGSTRTFDCLSISPFSYERRKRFVRLHDTLLVGDERDYE